MIWLSIVVSVASAAEPAQPTLLVPVLAVKDSSSDAKERQRFADLAGLTLAHALRALDVDLYRITTHTTVGTELGLETDEAEKACKMKLADCLELRSRVHHCRYLLAGALTRTGDGMRFDLKLYDTERRERIAKESASFGSDAELAALVPLLVPKVAANIPVARVGPPRPKLMVMSLTRKDSSPDEKEQFRFHVLSAGTAREIVSSVRESGRYRVIPPGIDITDALGRDDEEVEKACGMKLGDCLKNLSRRYETRYFLAGMLTRAGGALRIDLKLYDAERGVLAAREGASVRDELELSRVVSELVPKLVRAPE